MNVNDLQKVTDLVKQASQLQELGETKSISLKPNGGFTHGADFWAGDGAAPDFLGDIKLAIKAEHARIIMQLEELGVKIPEEQEPANV